LHKTPQAASGGLVLDETGLDAARKSLSDGAITPAYGPHRDAIVKLLNDALATELVCVLRYKRHYFTASGVSSPAIADEFLVHANEESGPCRPHRPPHRATGRRTRFLPGHAAAAQPRRLRRIHRPEHHGARQPGCRAHRGGDLPPDDRADRRQGPTTRRMLEDVLADEEEHADELKDWLDK
jgi:bacterioferritin